VSAFKVREAREKVAIGLLILNEKNRSKKTPDKIPVMNVTRAGKANYIGTTVETLVRMLNKLKAEHFNFYFGEEDPRIRASRTCNGCKSQRAGTG
jgi:hypothetical protein